MSKRRRKGNRAAAYLLTLVLVFSLFTGTEFMSFASEDTTEVMSLEKGALGNEDATSEGDEVGNRVVEETEEETGSATGNETEDGVVEETGEETGSATGNETGDGVVEETGEETGSATGNETGDELVEETGSETGDGSVEETGEETGDGAVEETGEETGSENGGAEGGEEAEGGNGDEVGVTDMEGEEETGKTEDGEVPEEKETELKTVTLTSEPMSSDGIEIIASGSYDKITWDIDANYKLTVMGEGNISSWEINKYWDRIESAEIKVKKSTSAAGAFDRCSALKSVDLSEFDASELTSTKAMFRGCKSLTSVDLSGWNTNKITDMSAMFEDCSSLTHVELSDLNTQYVQNMAGMFDDCSSLTNIDLSGFDTGNVTKMTGMFHGCKSLTDIDLSGFDKCQSERIHLDVDQMFIGCSSLRSVDLSGLDGSKVTSVNDMFSGCSSLRSVDLSGLDTSTATYMGRIFLNCSKLSSINLDGWNLNYAEDSMFYGCDSLAFLDLSSVEMNRINDAYTGKILRYAENLNTIYTPVNLTKSIALPTTTKDFWYKADGTQIWELPQNLDYSIVIKKNEVPVIPDPYITVTKTKTAYDCDDIINIDDIRVTYFDSNGASKKLTEGYTVNASEINMTTPGKKELVVTYGELTATVELTVTCTLQADKVTIALPECIYNGQEKQPVPEVSLTAAGTRLKQDKDYTVSYRDNVDAGVNTAQVKITGIGDYKGSLTQTFTITPAQLTITAKDMIRAVGEAQPAQEDYKYSVTGLCGNYPLLKNPVFTCKVDMNKKGTYTITPSGANAGDNYTISYVPGTLTVAEERVVYTVSFDLRGHGTEMKPITDIKAGSLISKPEAPTAEGYTFGGWYTDKTCKKAWNFATDIVQDNMTLYACWMEGTVSEENYSLRIQEIPDQTYTGSTVKPAVRVYGADGSTLLKAGKDYTIKYYNNIEADANEASQGGVSSTGTEGDNGFTKKLAYVTITGKGNYKGTIYRNFHILPASIGEGTAVAKGITLKCADQLTVNTSKAQKPFGSLKYKKAMKAGRDFDIILTTVNASEADGTELKEGMVLDKGNASPAIPAGYRGTFLMEIKGKGNYTGAITKTIYVSDTAHLMKNFSISLGKNQKRRPYQDGNEVYLTPGYYDAKTKKYYRAYSDGTIADKPEANGNDLFTVKKGKTYLTYGTDYTVSYANNRSVGTATMTITGIGEYSGSKSITYAITGTAFNTKNVTIGEDFKKSVTYTGRPQIQSRVKLTTKAGVPLIYGEHYTIRYKNNIRKGTATMQFIAKPESGFSGSFNKTFKITAQELKSAVTLRVTDPQVGEIIKGANDTYTLKSAIPYNREGAKPADRIVVARTDSGEELKEGTDYTVSYAYNKAVTTSQTAENKKPVMTIKGKGNYTGNIKVNFTISEAAFGTNDRLTVTATPIALNGKKAGSYQYQPRIKVTEGKQTLRNNKDYTVKYINCRQTEVESYLSALANGSNTTDELDQKRPKAEITSVGNGYKQGETKTVNLEIYRTKLTTNNLYVVISQEGITYTGAQVTPEVTVYYGDARAVKAAKKAKKTDSNDLTDQKGSYKLTMLTDGNYRLSYGANIAAGKNKGTVTVTGTGLYGGSVANKFSIKSRDVY